MPINFLKKIKLKASALEPKSQDTHEMTFTPFATKHVLGAYVFPCKDLKRKQPLFNDGCPSLIFMPRASDDVILRQQGQCIALKSAWVCNGVIQDIHWEVPKGLEYIMVIRFNPSTFYSLFNIDPILFRKAPVCGLLDLVEEKWKTVIDEMYSYDEIGERIKYLDQAFSSHKIEYHFPSLVQEAIDYIEYQMGNTTVTAVLCHLGSTVNQKWLHRNFVKYVGISPKKYISLQRFIYTYGHYETHNSPPLLEIALQSGYYDYNHFMKEFKQYLGLAPTKYCWE